MVPSPLSTYIAGCDTQLVAAAASFGHCNPICIVRRHLILTELSRNFGSYGCRRLCTLSALSLASGRPLADGIDDQVVDPLDMELNGRHLLADRRHVVDQKSADKEVRARL
jgi:hypothetical protein